jgi:hypothetical protein
MFGRPIERGTPELGLSVAVVELSCGGQLQVIQGYPSHAPQVPLSGCVTTAVRGEQAHPRG